MMATSILHYPVLFSSGASVGLNFNFWRTLSLLSFSLKCLRNTESEFFFNTCLLERNWRRKYVWEMFLRCLLATSVHHQAVTDCPQRVGHDANHSAGEEKKTCCGEALGLRGRETGKWLWYGMDVGSGFGLGHSVMM